MKVNIKESILDFPKKDLDSQIWEPIGDDQHSQYQLTNEAQQKIQRIVDYISNDIGIDDFTVNIVGSMTSNCYSDDSDIDIHFNSPSIKKADADETTQKIRNSFDSFKDYNNEDVWHIGTHPFEVYYQSNKFQDMMSVGCYSFTKKMWIIGPQFQNSDFNPFEHYYDKDMRYVNNLIGDIRQLILEVFEKALIADKFDGKNKKKIVKNIQTLLGKASRLFANIKSLRKRMSNPKSEKDANKFRNNDKWKVSDSAFKLLDKFGYLSILREYASQHETGIIDIEKIIDVVRQNIGPDNKKLHEIEETDDNISSTRKFNIWIDDVRKAPDGFIWLKSTDDAISFIQEVGIGSVNLIDIDHDSGEYYRYGGDYIKVLDHLEMIGAKDVKIKIHSWNNVGIQNIRRIIRKNCSNGWKEVFDNDDQYIINEGAKEALSISFIASILAIPNILPIQDLIRNLKNIPKQEMKIGNDKVQDAIEESSDGEMIGNLSKSNTINAVARTIYAEAKGEGKVGQDAVASVILNRAGGKPENLIPVISARLQFSCWNKYNEGWNENSYKYNVPKNSWIPENRKIWEYCVDLASRLVNKTFKSTIGNMNSYLNKDTASKSAIDSWGKLCNLKIGKHSFGYLRNNDGHRRTVTNKDTASFTYIVKPGDSLEKIAKKFGTSVDNIVIKNEIVDRNKIRVGQMINI